MAEYYELTLTHSVQCDGRHDLQLEQPIIVKGLMNPYAPHSEVEREGLIDDMCRKLKEYWMQNGR